MVVVAAAVVVPVVLLDGDEEDPGGAGPATGTATATDTGSAAPADLSEVQRYGTLDRAHVPLGDVVTYEQVPPAGGQHWSAWLDCGVYDSPVPDEYAVHDLEHGAVWITYDPALDDDDVAALAEALPQNGIMSPYEGLPAPVVVTVWGTQLALTGADDPRLPLFVEQYDDGVTAPEPYASCAGGTADGTSA